MHCAYSRHVFTEWPSQGSVAMNIRCSPYMALYLSQLCIASLYMHAWTAGREIRVDIYVVRGREHRCLNWGEGRNTPECIPSMDWSVVITSGPPPFGTTGCMRLSHTHTHTHTHLLCSTLYCMCYWHERAD